MSRLQLTTMRRREPDAAAPLTSSDSLPHYLTPLGDSPLSRITTGALKKSDLCWRLLADFLFHRFR